MSAVVYSSALRVSLRHGSAQTVLSPGYMLRWAPQQHPFWAMPLLSLVLSLKMFASNRDMDSGQAIRTAARNFEHTSRDVLGDPVRRDLQVGAREGFHCLSVVHAALSSLGEVNIIVACSVSTTAELHE